MDLPVVVERGGVAPSFFLCPSSQHLPGEDLPRGIDNPLKPSYYGCTEARGVAPSVKPLLFLK